jgi:hypothetical protein
VEFTVGTEWAKCTLGEFSGAVPTPAESSLKLAAPLFENNTGGECSTNAMGTGKTSISTRSEWTLTAVEPTAATLTLPSVETLSFRLAGCLFYNSGAATVNLGWSEGVPGGSIKTSVLTFSEATIPIKTVGTCSAAQKLVTSMQVHGAFVVNDMNEHNAVIG